jgi:hypothetical protein
MIADDPTKNQPEDQTTLSQHPPSTDQRQAPPPQWVDPLKQNVSVGLFARPLEKVHFRV